MREFIACLAALFVCLFSLHLWENTKYNALEDRAFIMFFVYVVAIACARYL